MRNYYCCRPSNFKLDGGAMFGIIPRPLWEKKAPCDELNRIDLSCNLPFIIEKDEKLNSEKKILIDTGIGDYYDKVFMDRFQINGPSNPIKKSMAGISTPEEITDLILTHLHFDHVGGIAKQSGSSELVPVFPNAILHLHTEHYKYALSPTMRDSGSFHHQNFTPIIDYYIERGQINWLEGEEGIILDHPENPIRFRCSHGHTPFLAHPYDNNFIYLADLIPTSAHMNIPWVMGYDMFPGTTTIEKKTFLEFALEKNLCLMFEHDPKTWGGHLCKDEKDRVVLKNQLPLEENTFEITQLMSDQ
jgi:glyoxylase-like metal-dependent hydrolase (beta-lactamase superfamily II)